MSDQLDTNVIEFIPTEAMEESTRQEAIVRDGIEEPNTTPAADGLPLNRHVEAGRKGAKRFHQLVEYGKLYEQEHGLKRGRQRLRQLIEEGKLYEQEHGLSPRRTRKGRVSHKQVIRRFFDALMRMSRPSYRPQLARIVELLESESQ